MQSVFNDALSFAYLNEYRVLLTYANVSNFTTNPGKDNGYDTEKILTVKKIAGITLAIQQKHQTTWLMRIMKK